jgi:hypothetical protein
MADFRLPGTGYSASFKTLKVNGGALVTLRGGAGPPDPIGPLFADLVQSTAWATVRELQPDPASPQNIRLFRIVGLQRGSAQLTARVNKDPASALYCGLRLELAQAQEDFAIKFASKINLSAFRLTGIAPSVMLGQASIESSLGGRDPKTRTFNPKSRVVVSNTIFGITKPPGKFAWFTMCKTIVSTNPNAPRISAMTSKPRYAWNDGDLLTLANLIHSELIFGMGVPSYGSDVMNVIRTDALKISTLPRKTDEWASADRFFWFCGETRPRTKCSTSGSPRSGSAAESHLQVIMFRHQDVGM